MHLLVLEFIILKAAGSQVRQFAFKSHVRQSKRHFVQLAFVGSKTLYAGQAS